MAHPIITPDLTHKAAHALRIQTLGINNAASSKATFMNRIFDKVLLTLVAILCGAMLLALTAPEAKAEHLFKSDQYGFRIAFPDLWRIIDKKAPGAIVGYGQGDRQANGTISVVSCSVGATEAPSTRGKRQEQINGEVESLLKSGAMAKNYADAGLTVTETYTRTIGGVRALVVVGKTSENVYGQDMALIRQYSMFYRSSVGYVLTCQATPAEFPRSSLLFDRISDSFRFE